MGIRGADTTLPPKLNRLEDRVKRLKEATVEVKRLEEAGKRGIKLKG